jgi:hypothetical protein
MDLVAELKIRDFPWRGIPQEPIALCDSLFSLISHHAIVGKRAGTSLGTAAWAENDFEKDVYGDESRSSWV